jgi:eukaryotic-like serine/threonine-protein kinase
MNVSASRRTWEDASSPAAVRLAQKYEQAWHDSQEREQGPVLHEFLSKAGTALDGPGARLAVLRADMSLRWESGEKVGVEWYLERCSDLDDDTVVALIYEEFCLREEEQEHPIPAEYLSRFPQVAEALGRVLEIHELVGSGTTATALRLSLDLNGSSGSKAAFPEAGQTIADFYLVEELGRGSFARVFLAKERQLADRPVALKVTRQGSREPQTLARLQHTHIVPVHSHRIDTTSGLHLLCMPYFGRITLARILADSQVQVADTGAALAEALDRLEPSEAPPPGGGGHSAQADPAVRRVPPRPKAGEFSPNGRVSPKGRVGAGRAALERRSYVQAIAWWGARLAEALEHAHDRGVLHRDIKPSNVLVTSDGMPMLLDFNLAREPVLEDGTAAGGAPAEGQGLATLGGTIDYMAPEHLKALAEGSADRVDGRADLFGLGVVLYEALTGQRPFDSPRKGSSVMEALLRAADDRCRVEPRLRDSHPEVTPALEAVILHCLAPQPDNRYQSAGELAADLQAVADDLPLRHAHEPWRSKAWGWLRRRRRSLAMAAAMLVTISVVLVAALAFLLLSSEDYDISKDEYIKGAAAFEKGDYATAKMHFDRIDQVAGRVDLNVWERISKHKDRGDLIGKLWVRIAGLHFRYDLEEIKQDAQYRSNVAERRAQAGNHAMSLFHAADDLRFRLLLPERDDLPQASLELQRVLSPFFVLTSPDWTEVDQKFLKPLTIFEQQTRDRLTKEVNELLFLWIAAIDEELASSLDPADQARAEQDKKVIEKAVAICDGSLVWAQPKGPWLALKTRLESRLTKTIGGKDRAAIDFPVESSHLTDQTSALGCFQWGLLCLREEQFTRAIRFSRAVQWLRRAARLEPNNYWYQYFLAFLEDQNGEFDAALEHYSVACALHPDLPRVQFSRARLYRSKGRWDVAIEDMKAALNKLSGRPESSQVQLELGYVYQELGDFAKARQQYEDVIKKDPLSSVARAARLNRANMDAESGAIDRARDEYDALIASDSRDTDARFSRALLELRLGQAERSETDLTALLEIGLEIKNSDEVLAARALDRLLLGRAQEAFADASEAQQRHPCPAHERLRQRTLLAASRLDLLQLDRPDEVALLPLGGWRLRADLQAAADGLDRLAKTQKAETLRAALARAVILAALGDRNAAVAAANQAVEVSPDNPRALLIRARVRSFGGDARGAWENVERGLRVQLNEPGLLELRGELRAAAGEHRRALEDFNQAIVSGAVDRVHVHKASSLVALGDIEKAIIEWGLALRRDPELPEAFLGRAQAHIQLNHWNLALADLEQAAAWAHSDPKIELRIVGTYFLCLKQRPDRLQRWLTLAARTARHIRGVLANQHRARMKDSE